MSNLACPIAPRASRIPAARAAAVAWLTLAAVTRDTYNLTQARDFACARSAAPVDIIDALDELQPYQWMTLCEAFGIDYVTEAHRAH